jgi:VIT1/CCC1 family predicted Fe2+/Mn2+ transporter
VENIILFLALFTGTATAVQVSLFRRAWQQLLLAAAIAVGTYLFYPTAIQFSSKDI